MLELEESAVDECPRAIYTLHFFDENVMSRSVRRIFKSINILFSMSRDECREKCEWWLRGIKALFQVLKLRRAFSKHHVTWTGLTAQKLRTAYGKWNDKLQLKGYSWNINKCDELQQSQKLKRDMNTCEVRIETVLKVINDYSLPS